jgi:CHAT domain-containing protein
MESSLRLTRTEKDNGRLSAGDIFSLNINAYLVVLSACETALGKINRGDEIIGFTRAFIYAGTPSIITTLWKVNDMATYMLMSEFYKNLKTMRKADALRAAQLNLMKTYRHPFFWGAFVLNGAPE